MHPRLCRPEEPRNQTKDQRSEPLHVFWTCSCQVNWTTLYHILLLCQFGTPQPREAGEGKMIFCHCGSTTSVLVNRRKQNLKFGGNSKNFVSLVLQFSLACLKSFRCRGEFRLLEPDLRQSSKRIYSNDKIPILIHFYLYWSTMNYPADKHADNISQEQTVKFKILLFTKVLVLNLVTLSFLLLFLLLLELF